MSSPTVDFGTFFIVLNVPVVIRRGVVPGKYRLRFHVSKLF